jgi:hypothetical protein
MRLRRIDNGTLISFQAHESDPLSAERYLDSYLTLVLESSCAPTPAEAAG